MLCITVKPTVDTCRKPEYDSVTVIIYFIESLTHTLLLLQVKPIFVQNIIYLMLLNELWWDSG